uniref:Riboflavin transporter n=1 Tax=Parascaris univalens TaxID=6257 RepID=A0A914ZFM0_PARUN
EHLVYIEMQICDVILSINAVIISVPILRTLAVIFA